MIASLFGWTGAAAMMAAPFFIDTDAGKITAGIGLALLTVQAIDIRAFNLVALNLVGIAGYLWSLFA